MPFPTCPDCNAEVGPISAGDSIVHCPTCGFDSYVGNLVYVDFACPECGVIIDPLPEISGSLALVVCPHCRADFEARKLIWTPHL